jgi:Lon protease-like protein
MPGRSEPIAEESLLALLGGATAALKVFPLPGTVVFPGTPAPFHIFEPRYREMIADALAGDRLVAVATLRSAEDQALERAAVHPVACAGFLEAEQLLEDGRYNVLVRGISRVRLLEERTGTGKPYREFRVEVLEDVYPPGGPAALTVEVRTLEQCVMELARRLPSESGAADLSDGLAQMRVPARIADQVAAAVVGDDGVRLRILEELDVRRRLGLVLGEVAEVLLRTPAPHGEASA